VAKRPAAIPLAQETNGLSCAITLVPVARIGVALLLKAILPRPAVAMGTPTERIFFSIAVPEAGSNERSVTRVMADPEIPRESRLPGFFVKVAGVLAFCAWVRRHGIDQRFVWAAFGF
jgi:hypothetical protein